ncbi:hypothetical protein ACFFX0_04555 [Citricoccus parietis]|uniref:Uncharacterized protein n=1 Tax=Citricoccus parietis TaxID=592307 RepID=A0ABV5FUZ9_9MICC
MAGDPVAGFDGLAGALGDVLDDQLRRRIVTGELDLRAGAVVIALSEGHGFLPSRRWGSDQFGSVLRSVPAYSDSGDADAAGADSAGADSEGAGSVDSGASAGWAGGMVCRMSTTNTRVSSWSSLPSVPP